MNIKKILRTTLRLVGGLLLIPFLYLILAFILSHISVNDDEDAEEKVKEIFLTSNGVHLDIVFHRDDVPNSLKQDLIIPEQDNYIAFGWGDEGFYLNTPTWADLTLKTAINAAFLDGPTLMHVTPYNERQEDWLNVKLSKSRLDQLSAYILSSFQLNDKKEKIIIPGHSYGDTDTFYKAHGTYSLFNTCNTWANRAFKSSGLKAAVWTAFDSGLMRWYQ